ncbi:MAG: DUF294 nucleotidyltransferase-like domain-containing protein [Pseudomonadota bacterium]
MRSAEFLAGVHPWSTLPSEELEQLADHFTEQSRTPGEVIYRAGDQVEGLYVISDGAVEVTDDGETLSRLGPRNAFGERGLLRDGTAQVTAVAAADTTLLMLPAARFLEIIEADSAFRDFFRHAPPKRQSPPGLAETRVERLMTADPITVDTQTSIVDAAKILAEHRISSVLVVDDGVLKGILTVRDISGRVVAAGLDPEQPVAAVMTPAPVSLPPNAIGSDVLHAMMERGIGHVPIVGSDGLKGIVSQTDLTRFQAETSASLVGEIARAADVPALAALTRRIPELLAQLVGAGNRHEVVTRLITDIADVVTRRLLALAEADLGPPPVPYLWLACGSQGRSEQTGTSDQDNCLFLDDSVEEAHEPYFAALAQSVSDGLNACGYVYCPGDMMATNPRWRQPVKVWRKYFTGWIEKPDPMAQMLSSVMFDLRPIGGATELHADLQAETLEAASKNSIFVAHMVSNSLKHTPPLGLLRGLATLRSGEHRNTLDMKLNGVVPVVDLCRIYALRGRLSPVNTRARLEAARAAGLISETGGRDLIDAYDLIAQSRLKHQAKQVRNGERPDNFMPPSELSEFERSHLRNAFVVVRQMQLAATQGQGVL